MTAQNGEGVYGNSVGVVTPLAHKLSQNGPIVKDSTGTPRSGVFYAGNASLVTGKANMSYDVAAFEAAICRGRTKGTSFPTNDAVVNVATTAAPGSNSRIDVIYVQQQEFSEGDAATQAVIGVVQGVAAASPSAPALPAGAIELARAVVPAGITATTSATITQTAVFTAAAGGMIPFRTSAERTAFTPVTGQLAMDLDTGNLFEYLSGWKQIGGPGGWQTATLAANWSAPANYLAPAYRIVNGWCELRGTGRYSATIPTSNTNFLTGLPAPTSTDNDSVWLMGPSNASTVIFLNPRTDGIMRARSAATGGAGTDYVHLDGLRYWVG